MIRFAAGHENEVQGMRIHPLTRLRVKGFTAFLDAGFDFGPGINVFVGANGVGKTHLLKLLYASVDITRTDGHFGEKLMGVFLPYQGRIGRLVHRAVGRGKSVIEVFRGDCGLRLSFSNVAKGTPDTTVRGAPGWQEGRVECAYIPVKEMLAHAPGFRSLVAGREIEFEGVYADIVDRAYRPVPRGPASADRRALLKVIAKAMTGRVVTKNETFFLKNRQGNLEFMLLAEGMRKLALLWLLIQNGTLLEGSILFWDEPEANLNPNMMGTVVEILLRLQRMGVQIFLATHDYVTLKELDLRAKSDDAIRFHALCRDERGGVIANSTDDYLAITPNAIAQTFGDLYDRDIERALGQGGS